ncbi:MAG: hypothetical protein MJ057_02330 [Sphaerochaetaceae bacterium]|nr:hypothetical protein [Sphaerochaetaceae bacterium]
MLITLKNGNTEMVLSTLGAEPQSLKRDGIEYIWCGDKEYWFRHAPLLFPMIGPTPEDSIAYKGKQYAMPNNGFARDVEFQVVSQSENSATFVLEDSEESRAKNYPFGFKLTATYTLREDGYDAKAEIYAKDDLYYTFGWHPAFSLDMNGKGCALDTYKVTFDTAERVNRDYAVGNIFQTEKDFLVGDVINMSRTETDKGALILRDVKSSKVTLTSSQGPHGVTATMGRMNVLTLWTCAPKHGQYLCIEPMLSFGDKTRTMNIDQMQQTTFLAKGNTEVYENSFSIF